MSNEKMGYAPYALIPLAPEVVLPDWQDQVSHSTAQLDDSYDGVINVTLKAGTEIFTANEHEKDSKGAISFSKNPEGEYYIAGSSIRGMLRNVLEVASYGKSMFVDNHVVATRTTYDKHYMDAFTSNDDNKHTLNKPVSGWLKFNAGSGNWELRTCELLKLAYSRMRGLGYCDENTVKKENIINKYKRVPLNQGIKVDVTDKAFIAKRSYDEKRADWHAVFLGHMTGKKDKKGNSTDKKGDYLFKKVSLKETPLVVSATVFQNFKQAHQNKVHREKQSHLDYLLKNPSTIGIPVFAWLTEEYRDESGKHPKKVSLISLAQLPRLTAKRGPKDCLDEQKQNNISNKLDFPELLFGRVFDDKKDLKVIEKGLKHRISAADFTLSSGHEVGSAKTHLLGSPAASYTPAFLEPSAKYKSASGSYLDDEAKLIGSVKRYFNHAQAAAKSSGKGTQLTTFYPMPKGAEFTGEITFKNLNKKELGALLWAISLGENKDNYHQVGMAKPYGYGSVQLNIDSLKLREWPNNLATEQGQMPSPDQVFKQLSPKSLQAGYDEYGTFIKAFKDYIIEQVDKEDDFNELSTIKSLQVILKQYDNVPSYMPLSNRELTVEQKRKRLTVTYDKGRQNNQGRIPLPLEAAMSLKRSTVKE